MYQFVTLNGIYTIRKKDSVITRLTTAIWDELGECESVVNRAFSHYDAEDFIHLMKGEPCSIYGVLNCIMMESSKLRCLIDDVAKGEVLGHPRGKSFRIICNDGAVETEIGTLKHRFQLIEDFCSDNPLEDTITLPFNRVEIKEAIRPGHHSDFKLYQAALHYLNPHSNLYPFYYDLSNCSLSELTELADKLTEGERRNIETCGTHLGYRTPSREGVNILALVPNVKKNITTMSTLFPDKPSFVFCQASPSPKKLQILLNWDFSKDKDEFIFPLEEVINAVNESLEYVFGLLLSLEEVKKYASIAFPTKSTRPIKFTLPYDVSMISISPNKGSLLSFISYLSRRGAECSMLKDEIMEEYADVLC
jgi:hypothetical protein